jgi:uncharacterized C2H2 Zn-finger protein
MDRPTTTFPCPSCDKIYLTQHSLTRHSHNHKKTSEHICPSCNVVFYRKDLLARHLKMHDPVQGGNRGGRRLRCHTACINCRDARIKCDSNKPCASCAALGKHCAYSTKSSRVSTNTRIKSSEETEVSASILLLLHKSMSSPIIVPFCTTTSALYVCPISCLHLSSNKLI